MYYLLILANSLLQTVRIRVENSALDCL